MPVGTKMALSAVLFCTFLAVAYAISSIGGPLTMTPSDSGRFWATLGASIAAFLSAAAFVRYSFEVVIGGLAGGTRVSPLLLAFSAAVCVATIVYLGPKLLAVYNSNNMAIRTMKNLKDGPLQ